MNSETENLLFQKEFNEIIDGFGYEWEESGKDIILSLSNKKSLSDGTVKLGGRWAQKISDPRRKKQLDILFEDFNAKLTFLKGLAIKEILVDIVLIIIFSCILYHFIFVTFILLGVVIDSLVIAALLLSSFYSIKEVLSEDQSILSKKYGFRMTVRGFATSRHYILRKLKHSKYRVIFFSAILLTLSISSFTYPSPPLIYVTRVINFSALLLASTQMGSQYVRNREKHRNLTNSKPTLLAVSIVFLFFLVYVSNYFIYYPPLAFISAFFVDIIVIYSIPSFIMDLIRINRFRKWSDSKVNHNVL